MCDLPACWPCVPPTCASLRLLTVHSILSLLCFHLQNTLGSLLEYLNIAGMLMDATQMVIRRSHRLISRPPSYFWFSLMPILSFFPFFKCSMSLHTSFPLQTLFSLPGTTVSRRIHLLLQVIFHSKLLSLTRQSPICASLPMAMPLFTCFSALPDSSVHNECSWYTWFWI